MKEKLPGEDRLIAMAEAALRAVEADQAEVVISAERSALTRFAESVIHQNLAQANTKTTSRAVMGKQIGCATTNRTDAEGFREVAAQASRLAKHSAPNPEFRSLPPPKPIRPVEAYSEATNSFTPEQRAEAAKEVIAEAQKVGAVASGSLSVESEELVVANSLGIRAYQASTQAQLVTVIAEGDASGYGDWYGKDISALQPAEIGNIAAQKCAASRGAQPLAPGEYPVLLEPAAVSELLLYLAEIGLGATAFQEGRSFMCDQIGKKLAADGISLWDDGHDNRLLSSAFDFEGVPKQKVMLIENGVAKGIVYDSYTAAKEGKESTGHALPAPNIYGPAPLHLCLAPGESTLEEMISSVARGLFVTRFHYVNVVSHAETILTGMTRDGTFLIENGKISRPVQKLRFTESILKTLQRTEMLSREVKLDNGFLVPAIKVSGLTFTS